VSFWVQVGIVRIWTQLWKVEAGAKEQGTAQSLPGSSSALAAKNSNQVAYEK